MYMGKCSLCGSPGSNFSSCPLNPNAISTNMKKHPLAKAPSVPKAHKLPRGQVGINTKAWELRKPQTKDQRREMSEKCGDKCYLIPELEKYPVCSKGSCDHDCDGIRAARNLTYLVVNKKSTGEEAKRRAMRARAAAEKLGTEVCGWS